MRFRGQLALTFGIVIAVLAALGFEAVSIARQAVDAGRTVSHTYDVLGHVQALLSAATDAEASVRGFALTGREDFLTRDRQARATAQSTLNQLRSLTADNPDEQRRLDLVEAAVRRRFALLDEAIAERREGGIDAAVARSQAMRGAQAMDEARRGIADVEAAERALLAPRLARADRVAVLLDFIVGFGVAFVFVSGAAVFLLVRREFRLRAELASRSAQLASVVDDSEDAILTIDRGGRVMTANAAVLDVFGYEPAELIGRDLSILVREGREEAFWGLMTELKRGVRLSNHRVVTKRKDGRPVDLSLSASPIVDRAGEVVGMSGIARDVTRDRRIEASLERSEQQLRALVDLVPTFRADADGRWTFASRSWCDLTGLMAGDAAGDGWLSAVHPDDRERVAGEWARAVGAREPFRSIYRMIPRAGSERVVQCAATRVDDGASGAAGYIGVLIDVAPA